MPHSFVVLQRSRHGDRMEIGSSEALDLALEAMLTPMLNENIQCFHVFPFKIIEKPFKNRCEMGGRLSRIGLATLFG